VDQSGLLQSTEVRWGTGRLRLVLCGLLFLALPAAALQHVTITPQTTVFIDQREAGPLQKTANDLAGDLSAVFGTKIHVIHNVAQARPTTIWISSQYELPKAVQKPSGWERLHIQAVEHPWPGSPALHAIVLTGSDMRGAMYACYQFSQQFLGVDPLYWWTDNPPKRRNEVSVPAGFEETEGPTFHYRGFFVNDEDLLTGWRSGIPHQADIAPQTWDHVFEAILRLKGNMVVPGTWIFPYELQVKAAGERGLVVTQHHVNVLGLNTYRWPKDKPYSFISDPQILEAAWKTSIDQYPPNFPIVWSVGYRGENDYPFWLVDKSAPKTDAGRAHIIQQAIEKEISILKAVHPNAEIVFNAWQEAARFIRAGLLKVPSGVTLVWPDNGHGVIQDHGEIVADQGVYYHTAMIDGRSNHFTEFVPLETIREELGRAVKAGATRYLLVNTANLRPVPMTTRAVMELAWNAKPWIATQPDEAAAYLRKWSREEFGVSAAPSVEKYYRAYFAAPAMYGKAPDERMGDHFYETLSRIMLERLARGEANSAMPRGRGVMSQSLADMAASVGPPCREAGSRWRNVYMLAKQAARLIPADRKQFFQANVLTQAGIYLHSNRMLAEIAAAAQASTPAAKMQHLRAAVEAGDQLKAAMHAADYGKWAGFYTDGDWLLDVPLTVALARDYIGQLEGRPQNLDVIIRGRDHAFGYDMITAYQGGQRVQF
jgi:hypothetical protein